MSELVYNAAVRLFIDTTGRAPLSNEDIHSVLMIAKFLTNETQVTTVDKGLATEMNYRTKA